MKRFSRIYALILTALMLIGVMSFVTVAEDDIQNPSSIKEYVQMCD